MEICFNNQKTNLTCGVSRQIPYQGVRITFYTWMAVQDEVRGYILFDSNFNSWVFINKAYLNHIYKFNKLKLNKVALVLESPHKDEYNSNYFPIRPANGRTGKNIDQKICTQLKSCLTIGNVYEIFIINAIQYQTSCYNEFNKIVTIPNNTIPNKIKWNRKIRNEVFRKFFHNRNNCFNMRKDFIKRLTNYNPDIVVNAVTSNLKSIVETAIKEFDSGCDPLNIKHPSAW